MTCLVVFHKVQIMTALLFIPMKKGLEYPKPTFNGLFISSPLWKTIEKNISHSFFVVPFGEPSFLNFFYFAKVTIICWKNKSTSCKNPFFLSFLKIFWTQTSENSP
jgi:hypothetical protein